MQYLCCCTEEKCLNHFLLGNENLPEEKFGCSKVTQMSSCAFGRSRLTLLAFTFFFFFSSDRAVLFKEYLVIS